MSADIKATSDLYWMSAIITALIDSVFVTLLAWRIRRLRFRQLPVMLIIVSAIFWSLLLTTAAWAFWDSCYGYIFPNWVRWLVPIYGFFLGGVALLFWWLALRLPGNSIVNFCILGGLHSLPGHLWGVYGRGLLQKCPILHDVSPASALVFGIFEFVFYWSVVITIAAMLRSGYERWNRFRQRRADAA